MMNLLSDLIVLLCVFGYLLVTGLSLVGLLFVLIRRLRRKLRQVGVMPFDGEFLGR